MLLLAGTRTFRLFKVCAVCGLLGGTITIGAEKKPTKPKTDEKPIDPERVKILLADLGSEEFTKREEATAELIKMGAKIRPQIEAFEKNVKDPEVRLRLKRIRNHWEFPAPKSLKEALSLHQRLLQKAVAETQSDVQVQRTFRRVDKVVEQVAGFLKNDPKKYGQLAELRYNAAKAYVEEFKRNRNRSIFVTQAASDAKKCLVLYQLHLKSHPNDEKTMVAMKEAQMMMYYSLKHAPLNLRR